MAASSTTRRLRPAEREEQIIAAAAEFFAERGFAASTRELAAKLDVTQALLYRYFASKDLLIEAVFKRYFLERWDPAWHERLRDRASPLAERLIEFYRAFSARGNRITLRLFIRANLDGLDLAHLYRPSLTVQVIEPVVTELRLERGLPAFEEVPLLPAEREIALVLHGSLIFARIRRDIYRTRPTDEPDRLIELHVRTFLPGALEQISALHRLSV